MQREKTRTEISAEDALGGAVAALSLFLPQPQFQGQTKQRLASAEAAKLVGAALRDHFAHWLAASPARAARLSALVQERAQARTAARARAARRKPVSGKGTRLPGKLVDCRSESAEETEVFLVEGGFSWRHRQAGP